VSHASTAAGIWSPLIRAALIVTDLERSQRFYRELFGLDEVHACGDTRSVTIATLLGAPPGSRTRFAVLKRPGPGFGMLGLFELSEPVPPPLAVDATAVRRGEVVLVFYHASLDPLVARVAMLGGRVVVAPLPLQMRHRFQREAVFADPDGVKLNVIERDPHEALALHGPGLVL
jgi:catechol 2,3-dioxygenase-like lactoylglutathione lyase family enzyme